MAPCFVSSHRRWSCPARRCRPVDRPPGRARLTKRSSRARMPVTRLCGSFRAPEDICAAPLDRETGGRSTVGRSPGTALVGMQSSTRSSRSFQDSTRTRRDLRGMPSGRPLAGSAWTPLAFADLSSLATSATTSRTTRRSTRSWLTRGLRELVEAARERGLRLARPDLCTRRSSTPGRGHPDWYIGPSTGANNWSPPSAACLEPRPRSGVGNALVLPGAG